MFNDVEEFRAYVLHMLSEHRRLNAAVRTIERRWRVVDEGSKDTVSDLISGLEQLHRDLHHHFTDEENGGCIEEAVARCPSLSQAATKLEHEHTFLLSHLRGVIDQLEQGDIDRHVGDQCGHVSVRTGRPHCRR